MLCITPVYIKNIWGDLYCTLACRCFCGCLSPSVYANPVCVYLSGNAYGTARTLLTDEILYNARTIFHLFQENTGNFFVIKV